MIESLRINNFKQHKHLNLDFPSGLTLITGPNYSGKSSILHAIRFAMEGPGAVPGGAKRVVRRGADPSTLHVELKFFRGNHTYYIDRKVNSARLFRGEELIATGASSVTKEVERLLGLPSKLFNYLKYVAQGQTQGLLTLGATELHRVLEHVSGAQLVNRVITRAAEITAEASAGLAAVGEVPDLSVLSTALEQARARSLELRAEVERLEAALKVQTAEYERLGRALKRGDAVNRQWQSAEQTLQSLEQQLRDEEARLAEEVAEIERLSGSQEEARAAVRLYEDLRYRFNQWEQARRDALSAQEVLKSHLDDEGKLQAAFAAARENLQGAERGDVEEAQKRLSAAWAEVKELQTRQDDLQRALTDAVCPACQRPYSEDPGHLERAQHDLEEVLAILSRSKSVYRALSDDLDRQHELRAEWERLYRKVETVKVQIEQRVHLRQGAEAAWEAARARFEAAEPVDEAAVRAAKEQAEAGQQTTGYLLRVQDSRAKTEARIIGLGQMRDAVARPAEPRVDLGPLKEQAEATLALQVRLSQELAERRGELWAVRERLLHLEQDLGHGTLVADRAAGLQEKKQVGTSLVKYLRTNRDRFMADLWEQVMQYASGFASACTGGAISKVGRTEDGSFTYEEAGFLEDVVAASGAQRAIMSLGVQLALDTLLPDTLGALLLDEPSADMDPAHATTLVQMLSQSNRQIILVSHRELDAAVAQAHIDLS